MRKRHVARTEAQMVKYRGALASGVPKLERDALKAWLGSIKELIDTETLTEILVYIYTKNFPNEQAVALLNKEEKQEETDRYGNVRFL